MSGCLLPVAVAEKNLKIAGHNYTNQGSIVFAVAHGFAEDQQGKSFIRPQDWKREAEVSENRPLILGIRPYICAYTRYEKPAADKSTVSCVCARRMNWGQNLQLLP